MRVADGPVQVREGGERLGLDASVRGKLKPLRAKITKLAGSWFSVFPEQVHLLTPKAARSGPPRHQET
ncbi:hypothetical protein [Streptomyces sp. NPDC101776]|uniref:hypothetical protein n=1 Tax=Streptomyces sp. NPDC101776 TaxID=3366146 RepID=UPI00380B2C8F